MEKKRLRVTKKQTRQMRKIMMICMAALLTAAAAQAQTAAYAPLMGEVWKAMPDSLLPYLTHNDRLDMADYLEANMKAEVTNRLDGKSVLDTLGTDYLHLSLSPVTTIEMGILPVSEQTADSCMHVVCVITTYGNPKMESRLKFYTTKWNEWHPTPPVVPEQLFADAGADSYPTAAFGTGPQELTLSLSQMVENAESDAKNGENGQKKLKWHGNTFKEY